MFQKIKEALRGSYRTLNQIKVSRSNLLKNYNLLSSLNTDIHVSPVLKSNAYGHGLVQVAKALDGVRAPFFSVDSLYEGYELLKAHIQTPILIMGAIHPESLAVKELPFSYAVYTKEMAKAVNEYQSGKGIHIFVDTGMHREGVSMENLPHFVEYISSLPRVKVEGLMTHLGMSQNPENPQTQEQIKNFERAQNIVRDAGFRPQWIHALNSEGLLNHKDFQRKSLGNVARAGLALYGISHNTNLHPALSFVTTLGDIKTLKRGESLGYDFTFTAEKDMKIGILPVGYNDGVDLRLSNKGTALLLNTPCNIVGRVSMNITVIDISDVPQAKIGDEVLIYSKDRTQKNSVHNTASLCNTIPYEILIHLHASTKRTLED